MDMMARQLNNQSRPKWPDPEKRVAWMVTCAYHVRVARASVVLRFGFKQ